LRDSCSGFQDTRAGNIEAVFALNAAGTSRFTKIPEKVVPLAPELELFEPLDSFPLVRDDLGLPDEGDGHETHGENAENQYEADIGLVSGNVKNAPKPCHK
jgi:hypothetical protein